MLCVFDVDGTLANCDHRMHYIKPNPSHDPVTGRKIPRRFDLFHNACVDDTVIQPVADIYRRLVADPNTKVVLLTGRPMSVRYYTQDWFTRNGLDGYDGLYTKPSGQDMMPDVESKRLAADRIERDFGMPISMVFEDRARVVAMWRARGNFVFDVAQVTVD